MSRQSDPPESHDQIKHHCYNIANYFETGIYLLLLFPVVHRLFTLHRRQQSLVRLSHLGDPMHPTRPKNLFSSVISRKSTDERFVTNIHIMVMVYLVLRLMRKLINILNVTSGYASVHVRSLNSSDILDEVIGLVELQVNVSMLSYISYQWLSLHQRYTETSVPRLKCMSLLMLLVNVSFFLSQVVICFLGISSDTFMAVD